MSEVVGLRGDRAEFDELHAAEFTADEAQVVEVVVHRIVLRHPTQDEGGVVLEAQPDGSVTIRLPNGFDLDLMAILSG